MLAHVGRSEREGKHSGVIWSVQVAGGRQAGIACRLLLLGLWVLGDSGWDRFVDGASPLATGEDMGCTLLEVALGQDCLGLCIGRAS